MEFGLRSVEQQGAHEAGGMPWGAGAPPYLVGPLMLHRPQLQPHIFVFGEKK